VCGARRPRARLGKFGVSQEAKEEEEVEVEEEEEEERSVPFGLSVTRGCAWFVEDEEGREEDVVSTMLTKGEASSWERKGRIRTTTDCMLRFACCFVGVFQSCVRVLGMSINQSISIKKERKGFCFQPTDRFLSVTDLLFILPLSTRHAFSSCCTHSFIPFSFLTHLSCYPAFVPTTTTSSSFPSLLKCTLCSWLTRMASDRSVFSTMVTDEPA